MSFFDFFKSLFKPKVVIKEVEVIKEIKIPKPIDPKIEKYKEYWNNKHPHKILYYKGRGYLQGYEPDNELNNIVIPARTPLQMFCQPNDPKTIQILKDNNLLCKDPLKCDNLIFEIYKFTRKDFVYNSDQNTVGLNEYWLYPWEMRQYPIDRGHDCDDYANQLASYLIASGIPNWRVRIVCGFTYSGYGHSTVYVLLDDMKTWIHTNSTSMIPANVNSIYNEWFTQWNDENPNDIDIDPNNVWFSFNNEFAWETFDGESGLVLSEKHRNKFEIELNGETKLIR